MAPTRSSTRAAAAESAKKVERKSDKTAKVKVEEDVKLETESPASPVVSASGISEYERARLENIRRNEQFLSGLGVAVVKSALTPASKPKPVKRASVSKGLNVPLLPTRRSSRVTVDKLAAEVTQLRNEGKEEEANQRQSELDAMLAKQKEGSYEVDVAPSAAYEVHERIAAESISLLAIRGEEESEEAVKMSLLTALKDAYIAANSTSISASSTVNSAAPKSRKSSARPKVSEAVVSNDVEYLDSTADAFSQLSLSSNDVIKLTPQRITAVALHPSSSRILAAAGDKNGYLGIWDADFAGSDSDNDGVYTYRPHISNIAKLDFSAVHDHRLYSTSYDGTVRFVDLASDGLVRAFESPETLRDMYFTDSCFLPNQPDNLLIAKSDGYVALADLRAGKDRYVFDAQVHDSKVSSVQIHPQQEHLVISASNRDGIAFHDLRRLQTSSNNKAVTPLQVISDHTKAINGAYVSPDGQYLVSVSLDNTVRTWCLRSSASGGDLLTADLEAPHILRHDNHTGRWLSTFRPAFDPKRAHTLLLGSMLQPRRLEIYTVNSLNGNSISSGNKKKKSDSASFALELTYNLQHAELLASVNSRNCFHAHREVVLGSNSSGKVFLFR